ncbi:MAG: hypothetical protein H8F28_20385 [Fibrella sp.]|nr:hypothetical protein [Armatimonadota bacterium]
MGQPLHLLLSVGAYLNAVLLAAFLLSRLGLTGWIILPVALVLAFPLLAGMSTVLAPVLDKLLDLVLFSRLGDPPSRSKK